MANKFEWYGSGLVNVVDGDIALGTDTFKALMTTDAYVPAKNTDSSLANITNEVTGAGYTTGGASTSITLSYDNAADRLNIFASDVTWTDSTIAGARVVVIYKVGVDAANSLLLCYAVMDADRSTTNSDFVLDFDQINGILYIDCTNTG